MAKISKSNEISQTKQALPHRGLDSDTEVWL